MFQHWACGGLGDGWRIILILNAQAFFSQTPVPKVILMGIFFVVTVCLHVLHVRRKKPCMSYMSYMSDVKNASMSYISYIADLEKDNFLFFQFYNVRYVRHREVFHIWHVRHVRHGRFLRIPFKTCETSIILSMRASQGPTAWSNQSAHCGLVIAESRCAAFIDLHVDSPSPLHYDGDRYSGASSKPHKALGKSRWHIGLNQEPISKQARKNWFTKCWTRMWQWPYQAIQAATKDTAQRDIPYVSAGPCICARMIVHVIMSHAHTLTHMSPR